MADHSKSEANHRKPEKVKTASGTEKAGHTELLNSQQGSLLLLQRRLGNQGLSQLVRSGVLQAKLTVSRPDDPCEREADRVADEVMRMPEPALYRKPG
jgi:hypothetical protein